jgi:sulfur carrier protein
MHVIVNGRRTEIAAKRLEGLLRELDHEGTHVAVAVNDLVVPRARWAATELNSGDRVEIITPRQGG